VEASRKGMWVRPVSSLDGEVRRQRGVNEYDKKRPPGVKTAIKWRFREDPSLLKVGVSRDKIIAAFGTPNQISNEGGQIPC
jgi:hypothetical protein